MCSVEHVLLTVFYVKLFTEAFYLLKLCPNFVASLQNLNDRYRKSIWLKLVSDQKWTSCLIPNQKFQSYWISIRQAFANSRSCKRAFHDVLVHGLSVVMVWVLIDIDFPSMISNYLQGRWKQSNFGCAVHKIRPKYWVRKLYILFTLWPKHLICKCTPCAPRFVSQNLMTTISTDCLTEIWNIC